MDVVKNAESTTDAEILADNIKYLCDKADKFQDVWHIKLCRALQLLTLDETKAMISQESLDTAKRSADAACESNAIAKTARFRSWIAIVISALALVVSAIAVLIDRVPEL